MSARQIITNGDHAADALRAAFPDRIVLPWRDSLVDGPVPDLADNAFDQVRADYLAATFGFSIATVRVDFAARDAAVKDMLSRAEPIALWFETDLYDQLQLLDILARLAPTHPPLTLIQVPPPLPGHDLRTLDQSGETISSAEFAAASALWSAVRQPRPDALVREAMADGALPVTRTALRRLLQELPASGDGLSRVEREILRAADRGDANPQSAFRVYMSTEELPFLGDSGFFVRLAALATRFELIAGVAALPTFDCVAGRYDRAFLQAPLTLTARGHDCLAGRYDLAMHPGLDRWVGGTHVTAHAAWRWEEAEGRLIPPM